MLRARVTQKDVKAEYAYVIKLGYCEAQTLLTYEEPRFYSVRREGWAADVYEFDSPRAAIVTGYAPYGNIEPPHDLTADYEEQARQVLRCDVGTATETPEQVRRRRMSKLLADYVEAVLWDYFYMHELKYTTRRK